MTGGRLRKMASFEQLIFRIIEIKTMFAMMIISFLLWKFVSLLSRFMVGVVS